MTKRKIGSPVPDWCTIHFDECSDVVRKEIEPLLAECGWLIPSWCHDLHVWSMASNGNGAPMSVTVFTRARFAELRVFTEWLGDGSQERLSSLYHELTHLVFGDTLSFIDQTLDDCFEENPLLKRTLDRRIRAAIEGATNDMADALMRRLHPKMEKVK